MAPTYRLYRAERIGDGLSLATAYRSALTQYITADGTGAGFDDWIQDPADVGTSRYALAACEPSVHSQIAADVNVTVLSPEQPTLGDLDTWLDGNIGAALNTALRNLIEGDRIPLDDFDGTTTRRAVWRRIGKVIAMGNILWEQRRNDPDALEFMRRALSATIGSIPVAVRTRIGAWMQARGLDTTWIVGSTTVREVLKFIALSNAVLPRRFSLLTISNNLGTLQGS